MIAGIVLAFLIMRWFVGDESDVSGAPPTRPARYALTVVERQYGETHFAQFRPPLTVAGDARETLRIRDSRGRAVPYAPDPRDPSADAAQDHVAIPAVVMRQEDAKAHRTRFLADLGSSIAVTQITFHAPHAEFSRDVAVAAGASPDDLRPVANAQINRLRDGSSELSLGIATQEQRYWRIDVDNGDDAPITTLRPEFLAYSPSVVFSPVRGETYTAEWGLEHGAPVYDLQARLVGMRWHVDGEARLAAALNVPSRPRDACAFSTSVLMRIGVAIVAAVMILVAFRLYRKPALDEQARDADKENGRAV